VSPSQTQPVGLQAANRAFSRFAHATGFVCLSGAVLEVLGYQFAAPHSIIWPLILPLLGSLVAIVWLDRLRTTAASIAFLAVAGVSQFLLVLAILGAFPVVQRNHTLVLSLAWVALTLVAGSGFLPRSIILWGTAGFAIGLIGTIAATLLTRSPFQLDPIPLVVEGGLLAIELTDALTRSRRLAVNPELARAAIDDELSVLRYRIEVKAAAIMHDTVLNDLSAIATDPEGILDPRLGRQIKKDLATLIGEEWLIDAPAVADPTSGSDWRKSGLLTAVQEARDLSLSVDVTGDLGAITRITGERDTAVGLAVKQCLVNVLRHAEVTKAEVVVIGSVASVSIMVIDAGRGFSEQMVDSDRLGLRQSVRRRIENVNGEVRLWSTPGRGTSVLIQVPADVLAIESDA
jgi:signal transduction histidine kinase